MKVVFVGPTLPDAGTWGKGQITFMPPARKGDLVSSVRAGATVIGLVDGNFETVAPVWQKEILYALTKGVRIFGGASMGALRAAECRAFGMVGVGKIYRDYCEGVLVDDAAVAQLHGPAELGYLVLSLPLVNVDATLVFLRDNRRISHDEYILLLSAARDLFFKDRTWTTIMAQASTMPPARRQTIADLARRFYVDQKRLDALALVEQIEAQPNARSTDVPDWQLAETIFWTHAFGDILS